MAEHGETNSIRGRRRVWMAVTAVVAAVALLIGGLVAVALWAQREEPSAVQTDPYSAYRGPWESAMSKAGVKATFPGGPVDLQRLRVSGRQHFSATFTPEEVAALLAIYRYRTDALGGETSLEDVEVQFPSPGVASLAGNVILKGSSYHASIQAPVTYEAGRIVIGQGGAKLSVEGFSVGGRQRRQALIGVGGYLNSMLEKAPGLTIEDARVVSGGVHVEGYAPASIEHPSVLSPTNSDAIAASSR